MKTYSAHCIELNTGRNLTGRVIVDENKMSATVYSFDDSFNLPDDSEVFLKTADLKIFSLYKNVVFNPSTAVAVGVGRCFSQEIISNIVVIGHKPWSASDSIRTVRFRIDLAKEMLKHRKKFKRFVNSTFENRVATKIIGFSTKDAIYSIHYGGTLNFETNSISKTWIDFRIEYKNNQSIHEYLHDVMSVTQFFSYCSGLHLSPENIRIDALTSRQVAKKIKKSEYIGDFQVHYIWPKSVKADNYTGAATSPFIAADDGELQYLSGALEMWVGRRDAWQNSYELMFEALALRGEITTPRLINACNWFSELPNAKAERAIKVEDAGLIAATAASKALDLGYHSSVANRIKGVVKNIRSETSKEHLARIIEIIKLHFGENILREGVLDDMIYAFTQRNKAAHGNFTIESDEEYLKFARSIRAVEAVSTLLMLSELTLSAEGLKRLRRHRLVFEYKNAL